MRETPDQIITRVTAPRGGIARRGQLLAAGVSSSAIERRLDTGFLVATASGLYAVPSLATNTSRLWRALIGVPDSVLSRQTAATVHDMPVPLSERVHVTAAHGAGRSLHGVIVHETRLLRAEDVVEIDGLRVTTAERTLFDLASDYSLERLRFLVDRHYAGESAAPFIACVGSLVRNGVPGARKLRLLASSLYDSPMQVSELERRIWEGFAEFDLSGFQRQYVPPWYDGRKGIVDFAHTDAKLIVEGDGRRWHDSQQAMADDRKRDRDAAEHDWLVLRVSWHEVAHRPTATFGHLSRVLDRRRTQHPLAADRPDSPPLAA